MPVSISAIEIINVKGIDHKRFELDLMPNKPNLLVAPNGFGKSSIATAFASMNLKRMKLEDRDHHKEDVSLDPEVSIVFNTKTLKANKSLNEICREFDVTVIRSGLVAKAKRAFMGGVSSSLEIEPIPICKIPDKASFNYQVSTVRSSFGVNGKILPNITSLLTDRSLCEAILECGLTKLSDKRVQQDTSSLIAMINQQTGTVDQVHQWITDNLLGAFHTNALLSDLSHNLLRFNLATSETIAILVAYQIVALCKADSKSFRAAVSWLQYVAKKSDYDGLLQNFCSSEWQRANLKEDKSSKTLFIVFPQAHQLSNGQRDVLTLVIQMHKALYEGSKKPLILVIDEVFDYLDDANLVAFQYYVTSLIEKYKERHQTVYPIILTHLDPGVFFDFCFNKNKIHTHYLQAKSSGGKCKDMLKLMKARETNNLDDTLSKKLNTYWFHFHPDGCEVLSEEWPSMLRKDWRKSADFHAYACEELDRYLNNQNYDALAVCVAVRVAIEQRVYELLCTDEQKQKLIETHKTKEKLNYAAGHIPTIPDTYFLLCLIHNTSLHWKQGKDFVTPLDSKLNHPTIRNLIAELNR